MTSNGVFSSENDDRGAGAIAVANGNVRRQYWLHGVWSRVFWMVVISLFLVDIVWFAALIQSFGHNPASWNLVPEAWERIVLVAMRVQKSDAWAFLGVFAALVVAIQVSASANQQTRNPIADARSARFTIAATLTGAMVITAMPALAIAYAGQQPGTFVAMLASAIGIAFFAADGASIVLRQDTRRELLAEIRWRIRVARMIPIRGGRLDRPISVILARAIILVAAWSIAAALVPLWMIAAGSSAAGSPVGIGLWLSTSGAMTILAMLLAGLGTVAVVARWSAMAAPRRVQRLARNVIAAFSLGIGVWGTAYVAVAAIAGSQPGWVTLLATLAVALPLGVPLSALLPFREPRWWTPGGSLQLARACLARAILVVKIRRFRELASMFDPHP